MALCRRVQRRRDHHHDAVRVWPYEVYCEALEGEDRPRRRWDYRQVEEERPLPQELKLRVAEAYLHGEGDRKALALKHGVRNSARIRDRVKRYRGGGGPPSDRQATERPIIVETCKKSQLRYGYRHVATVLRKATGIRIADKKGFGKAHRLVQQRAHQETPRRKQPGRVQTRPGCLIHFF